jgi:hypothetical protein
MVAKRHVRSYNAERSLAPRFITDPDVESNATSSARNPEQKTPPQGCCGGGMGLEQ